MVLLERIELSTSSLPMTRSTTELQQRSIFGVVEIVARLCAQLQSARLRPNGYHLVKHRCIFRG